jgi:ABC-2 type transport system permease protein
MGRTWAIIEREMRRFRRSPVLIVIAMVMPLVQLVVLGYAFGGNVKHLKLAMSDQDRGVPAVKVRGGRDCIGAEPSTRWNTPTRAPR